MPQLSGMYGRGRRVEVLSSRREEGAPIDGTGRRAYDGSEAAYGSDPGKIFWGDSSRASLKTERCFRLRQENAVAR